MCHSFKGEGHEVGPPLETVSQKPVDYLLTSILDPSQSIEPRYTRYDITTRDDRDLTGIITAESPENLVLTEPGGIVETIARGEVAQLKSSKLSLMPDGFETILTKQSMADLIT